jgi:mono/diheme cytochrome c family protein
MPIILSASAFTATFALLLATTTHAQDNKASPRERAGAVIFGEHCSVCHGVRLMKQDAAYDLAAAAKNMDEERFLRGAMPSFAGLLKDAELADVYAYVKRGHSADLDDLRMESNH